MHTVEHNTSTPGHFYLDKTGYYNMGMQKKLFAGLVALLFLSIITLYAKYKPSYDYLRRQRSRGLGGASLE